MFYTSQTVMLWGYIHYFGGKNEIKVHYFAISADNSMKFLKLHQI